MRKRTFLTLLSYTQLSCNIVHDNALSKHSSLHSNKHFSIIIVIINIIIITIIIIIIIIIIITVIIFNFVN